MKWLGRVSAAVAAAAAGMGATVFLHPRSGPRSREAAAGAARRQSANVAAMVGGSVARAQRRGDRRQAQLAESVRAELSARHGAAADDLQVLVHKATVTLRGEVKQLRDIEAFEHTARAVPGVADVNNLLRLPVSASTAR
jgi:osmotically-inducible protein OsmY